jgi:sec-independent protein translocase protein TatA
VPSIGAPELLVILVLALIIFGPHRLPEIGKTIGKGLREFRKATSEIRAEIEQDVDQEPPVGRRSRTRRAVEKPEGDGDAPESSGERPNS